ILTILLIKLLNLKINNLICILLTLIIIYFIIYPKSCISASLNGALLFAKSILPTMFPFMVICNMIISLDGLKMYSSVLGPIICKPLGLSYNCCFPLIASFLCGYPMGAKYSTDLYKSNLISYNEFSRLLNIASNAGPLFLIGAVGTSMLGNVYLGYLLLIPCYTSIIIISIITFKKEEPKTPLINKINTTYKNSYRKKNIGSIISTSIQDSINNILILCGYVIIFSVIISMFKNLLFTDTLIYSFCEKLNIPLDLISGIFLGSIELTNGCNIISSSNLSLLTKLCLLAFLSSFGGLSILAQTSSFFQNENISILKYFSFKFLQGLIAIIIMFFSYILLKDSIATLSVSGATLLYINPILILLLISLITLILYKLLFIS
ncbi:sporulation integral membrane protein YlbJ, partial [Clostridium tarantellae]